MSNVTYLRLDPELKDWYIAYAHDTGHANVSDVMRRALIDWARVKGFKFSEKTLDGK